MSFKLGTFSRAGGGRFPAVVVEPESGIRDAMPGAPRIVPLERLDPLLRERGLALPAGASHSLCRLLDDWDQGMRALHSLCSGDLKPLLALSLAAEEVHAHAPIEWPRQVFCTVANYRGQIVETIIDKGVPPHTDGMDAAGRHAYAEKVIESRLVQTPYVCLKLPSAVIGPEDPLEIPGGTTRVDWELELGVVMGRACRHVSRAQALDYVAGYLLVNDITARDRVRRPDLPALGTDWLQSKCGPGFLPTGPFLVPAQFVPDPYALRLALALNGERMQDECASDMLFDIGTQIAYVSAHAQLLPGDILCTGTPAGCGVHHGRFLAPGDLIEASAPGLGVQRTRCVAPPDSPRADAGAGAGAGAGAPGLPASRP